MAFDSIPQRVQEQARRRSGAPAYCVRANGTWHPTSWRQYADDVRRAGKALIALGIEPAHTVGIIGFNRPEWTTVHLAAMSMQHGELAAARRVPQTRRPVARSGSDAQAVEGEGDAIDGGPMPSHDRGFASRGHVPDASGAVLGRRGDARAVWAEGDFEDAVLVAAQDR